MLVEKIQRAALCPHCGYDLERDAPVAIGDLVMDPHGLVTWKGHPVHLPAQKREVLWAIIKAGGNFLPIAVIASRIGHEDNDRGENHVCVQILQIRKAFKAVDPSFSQIHTCKGMGVRWAA